MEIVDLPMGRVAVIEVPDGPDIRIIPPPAHMKPGVLLYARMPDANDQREVQIYLPSASVDELIAGIGQVEGQQMSARPPTTEVFGIPVGEVKELLVGGQQIEIVKRIFVSEIFAR
jgi:hypothetical protein